MAPTEPPPYPHLARVSRRWQRRLIFTGGALAVGLMAFGLARAADGAQHIFQQFLRHVPYGEFVVTPLGLRAHRMDHATLFPEHARLRHSASDCCARAGSDGGPRETCRLARRRGQGSADLMALIFGASVGREGPTVQVGASMMFEIGQISRRAASRDSSSPARPPVSPPLSTRRSPASCSPSRRSAAASRSARPASSSVRSSRRASPPSRSAAITAISDRRRRCLPWLELARGSDLWRAGRAVWRIVFAHPILFAFGFPGRVGDSSSVIRCGLR